MFIYKSVTIISALSGHAFPFACDFWLYWRRIEAWGRRAEMRLVTCYNGKDKSGQDGTIINVQWSRPDQQIWKTVKLSLFAAQLNNTPSLQNTIEIKILIFSLSLSIIERNNRENVNPKWVQAALFAFMETNKFSRLWTMTYPPHLNVSVTKFPRYPCSAHPSLVWRQYQDRNHTSHNIETQYCGGMRYGSSGSNPTRLNSNSVYPYIHNIVLSYPDINVLNLIVSANVYRRKGTSWE